MHQKKLFPSTEVIKQQNVWFEYKFNAENPTESTYCCRLCSKHFDAFKLAKNFRSPLVDGTLGSYKTNCNNLSKHAKSIGKVLLIRFKLINN